MSRESNRRRQLQRRSTPEKRRRMNARRNRQRLLKAFGRDPERAES